MDKKGQILTGIVEEVFSFGAFLRLEDNQRAYVRKRLLTLEGDIDPRQILKQGDTICGKVILPAIGSLSMEISVRDVLKDPWPDFLKRHHPGDPVTAIIKHLYPDQVSVQIEAGVMGYIPKNDLATWNIDRPEDLLWSGDLVEAVIQTIEVDRKRVRLSVRRRLLELEKAQAYYLNWQERSNVSLTVPELIEDAAISLEEDEPVNLPQPVMVVENDPEVRNSLLKWLEDRGVRTVGCENGLIALEKFQDGNFSLLIIDLDMPGMNGLTLLEVLRNRDQTQPVVVMSDPDLIASSLAKIHEAGVCAAFTKPLDRIELRRFLALLASGELPSLMLDKAPVSQQETFKPFHEPAQLLKSRRSYEDRFQQGLDQLVNDTRAEFGALFHMDRESSRVSQVAKSGLLQVDARGIYGLSNSPVGDVIRGEDWVCEENVTKFHPERFQKLLNFVNFESCIGVPIQAGGKCEHALFIFHRQPNVFGRYRLRDVVSMATLFGAVLENSILEERIQSLGALLLSGELAAGFGHEINNKLGALDLHFSNLKTCIQRLGEKHSAVAKGKNFQAALHEVENAASVAAGLNSVVKGFRTLMESRKGGQADVNQVLQLAESQLHYPAGRAQVEIRLSVVDKLPLARSNPVALLQVFLNLMLNAIQQIEIKASGQRLLKITTSIANEGGPIQVRFEDSGPGIHFQLWQKIFDLGFTTRPGGSGLGLYISRSFIDAMGGRILVEKSLIPFGTTFLVELLAVGSPHR